jgi:hypothetical protein
VHEQVELLQRTGKGVFGFHQRLHKVGSNQGRIILSRVQTYRSYPIEPGH